MMGTKASLRQHRTGRGPKLRSQVAIDAQFRNSAGAMGKRGSGRTRRDQRARSTVKANLRSGAWA